MRCIKCDKCEREIEIRMRWRENASERDCYFVEGDQKTPH